MKNMLSDNLPYKMILDCMPEMGFIFTREGELITWNTNLIKAMEC